MGRTKTIAENINGIRERIAAAAARAGRSSSEITLVAVSKTRSPEEIAEAIAAGCGVIGENYVQEAESKLSLIPGGELQGQRLQKHLIGHLQRNKAARAAALFDMVQTVDTPELAAALGKHALRRGSPLEVLIEVNISRQEGRFGVAPEQALPLAETLAEVAGIEVCGLMAMGPGSAQSGVAEIETRRCFAAMRLLFETLPTEQRKVLSLGMTGDFEWAIEEGSTMVRIGAAIFGARR